MKKLQNKKYHKKIIANRQQSINNHSFSLQQLKLQAIELKELKQRAEKTLTHFHHKHVNQSPLLFSQTKSIHSSGAYKSRSIKNQFQQYISSSKGIFSVVRNQKLFEQSLSSKSTIRQMIKMKNKVQQKESKRLRNPFYKIQKSRTFSQIINPLNFQQKIPKKFKDPKRLKTSLDEAIESQKIFISRQNKHWYFAANKYRLKKMDNQLNNQLFLSLNKYQKEQKNTQLKQPQLNEVNKQISKQLSLKKIDLSLLDKEQEDKLNSCSDLTEEQEPKMRQKSGTVQYQQIKDYFYKKYVHNNQPNQRVNNSQKIHKQPDSQN